MSDSRAITADNNKYPSTHVKETRPDRGNVVRKTAQDILITPLAEHFNKILVTHFSVMNVTKHVLALAAPFALITQAVTVAALEAN